MIVSFVLSSLISLLGEKVGAPTPPFTVLSEEDAPLVDLTNPEAKEATEGCSPWLLTTAP